MKRLVSKANGLVHFAGGREHTLCGLSAPADMLGQCLPLASAFRPSTEAVTCRSCATLYCRLRNTPFRQVDDDALEDGMYGATEGHFCGGCATPCERRGSDAIVPSCDRYERARDRATTEETP